MQAGGGGAFLKSQFCGTWIQCVIYQLGSPDRQAQAWGGGDFVVTIYLRSRQGTDRLFRATRGSLEARGDTEGLELRGSHHHCATGSPRRAQPGGLPQVGGLGGLGETGDGWGARDGPEAQRRGRLCLQEAGREGSSESPATWSSLPPLAVTGFSPGQEEPGGERSRAHLPPPPSAPRPCPRTAAAHRLHAPRHVAACTATRGRGKSARPEETWPLSAHSSARPN